MRRQFETLERAVRHRCRGKEILFLQSQGNYGDALIGFGAELFLTDCGLSYRKHSLTGRSEKISSILLGAKTRLSGGLTLIGGGGGWCKAADVLRQVTKFHSILNPNFMVLPSTYEEFAPAANIEAFVRDKFESLARRPGSEYCPDMAFYMALISPERLLPNRAAPSKVFGRMFRIDNEGRNHGFSDHPDNYDLSTKGTHLSDPREFLRYLDDYEIIATDRLHIAIGATILGKIVYLSAGNYFKIKAIYESSIVPHFSNCTMIGDDEMRSVLQKYS